jgi:hypothetical protein
MERVTINESPVSSGTMRSKMDAAGSEQGQQIIPGVVALIWIFIT